MVTTYIQGNDDMYIPPKKITCMGMCGPSQQLLGNNKMPM